MVRFRISYVLELLVRFLEIFISRFLPGGLVSKIRPLHLHFESFFLPLLWF